MKNILLLILMVSGSITAFAAPLSVAEFNGKIDALNAAYDHQKISRIEFLEAAAVLEKAQYPSDYKLHTLGAYRIMLAKKLKRNLISQEDYDFLVTEKYNEYMDGRQQAFAAEERDRLDRKSLDRQAAEIRERLARQEREQNAAAEEYATARQAEMERQREVQRNAYVLQSIGNAIQKAYDQ